MPNSISFSVSPVFQRLGAFIDLIFNDVPIFSFFHDKYNLGNYWDLGIWGFLQRTCEKRFLLSCSISFEVHSWANLIPKSDLHRQFWYMIFIHFIHDMMNIRSHIKLGGSWFIDNVDQTVVQYLALLWISSFLRSFFCSAVRPTHSIQQNSSEDK